MTKSLTDQMGNTIHLKSIPKRIISLVPSQTELLYDLGLNDEVIGITKFCIYPDEWFKTKTRVGGTKKLDFEKIKKLNPDLIIGNKEENEEVQIKELMQQYPIWMSDIQTLEDACQMILSVGEIVRREKKAEEIVKKIKKEFEGFNVRKSKLLANSYRPIAKMVLYFIWKDPYMAVGNDTFIGHVLELCGLQNALSKQQDTARYVEITADQIKKADPDLIFLSSEPFPFKEKHIKEFQSICPNAKVKLVDGEMFSWYGSRLLKAPEYFEELIKGLE